MSQLDVMQASGSRRFRRYRVAWSVYCELPQAAFAGTLMDISVGGAFMRWEPTASGLLVGSDVQLTIIAGNLVPMTKAVGWCFAPAIDPLDVRAVVRWLSHHPVHACQGVGLEFVTKLALPNAFAGKGDL